MADGISLIALWWIRHLSLLRVLLRLWRLRWLLLSMLMLRHLL